MLKTNIVQAQNVGTVLFISVQTMMEAADPKKIGFRKRVFQLLNAIDETNMVLAFHSMMHRLNTFCMTSYYQAFCALHFQLKHQQFIHEQEMLNDSYATYHSSNLQNIEH